jgi:hypothetical protein
MQENAMRKLMQNNEFDQLLKDKLSNVEVKPSEHLWARIAPVIPKYNPWGQIFTPFTKFFFGSLVFVGTVVITAVSVLDNQKSSNSIIPAFENNLQAKELVQYQLQDFGAPELMPVIYQSQIPENNKNVYLVTADSKKFSSDEAVHNDLLSMVENTDNSIINRTLPAHDEYSPSQNKDESPIKIKSLIGTSIPVPGMILNSKPISYASALTAAIPHDYINISELALNISFQPEQYFFDTSIFATSRAVDYSLNVTIQYITRDFFFETGISGTYVSHPNTYRNTTIVKELVDSYEQVDSVQFVDVWDPNTSSWITQPVFYTSVVNVYNENTITDIISKNDSYLYIQIPVFMGLRKDIRRFSIEAKTGFIYSSLLFTSEQDKTFSNEEANILLAEQNMISLKRNRQYWSFLLGIGGSYKLTSASEIFITPTYRYLLNPLYPGNNPSRKTPYAFGVQTGIRFIF